MRMSRRQRRARQRRQRLKNGLNTVLNKSVQLAAAAVFLWNGLAASPSYAMPSGGQVAAGSAIINQAGSAMTIQQQTAQAVINWQSFGIAAGEAVRFLQPGTGAVMLNRVVGSNPSAIFGQLTANGKIFLVNQNGVYFAPGAKVSVGGLVATSLSITDADFMAGRYAFVSQNASGSVINQGSIVANNQGLVALLAPEARNEGVIVAQKGTVALASGSRATLDFNGDGKVQLALGEGALKAAVENKGLIEADGGVVLMTARTGQDLTGSVVNQSGMIRARSLDGATGSVTLQAVDGTVQAAGTIDASGAKVQGGAVDVFGRNITVAKAATIDVSGAAGGGTVRIGGDWQGGGDAPHARKVTVEQGAAITADATESGKGGTVAVWSDGSTKFDGTISARGGVNGGDGGSVETSGHVLQIQTGTVDASAVKGKSGEWLLDPVDITIGSSGDAMPDNGTYQPGVSSTVQAGTINDVLNNGTDVIIKTSGGSGGSGDITVNGAIAKNQGGSATLTLQANNNIVINADIASTADKLNIDLNADTDAVGGGIIRIAAGKTISTNGGSVLLHGGAGTANYAVNQTNNATPGVDLQGNVTTGGGAITVYGQSTAAAANAVGVSLAGTLNSGNGDISINGYVNNTIADSTSTGVRINGAINAGMGKVTITGRNDKTGGAGTAVALLSGADVAAKNAVLIGNNMTFDSTARVVGGSSSGTATLQPLDADRNIFVGTSGTGLALTGNLFSQDTGSVFQGFANTVIGHQSGTGTITVNGATFGSDVTLQATGTGGKIAVPGALNAGTHIVTLKVNADSGGTGIITATGLNLQGTSAAFSLTGANTVNTLAGNVKSVAFTNNGDFAVDTVGTATGLIINGDTTNILTSTAGNVTIAKNITKSAGSGTATLTVKALTTGKAITVNSGAAIQADSGKGKLNVNFSAGTIALTDTTSRITAQGGNITLQSDTLSLPVAGITGGMITSTGGALSIDTLTAGKTVDFGGASGDLNIAPSAFGAVADAVVFGNGFSQINIGGTNAGTVSITGSRFVSDPLTIKAQTAITMNSGSGIDSSGDGGNALTLDAPTISFPVSGTGTLYAGNTVTTVATSPKSVLTLRANAINNWSNVQFANHDNAGTLFIQRQDTGGFTVGGNETDNPVPLVSDTGFGKIATGNFRNVTIGTTGSGDVMINSITALPAYTSILSSGNATLAGSVNSSAGAGKILTLKVGALTQNSGSALTVDKLLLLGSGNFALSAGTNNINTVAAKLGGGLTLTTADNLVVGTVEDRTAIPAVQVNGITAGAAGNVKLAVAKAGGTLTLRQPVQSGTTGTGTGNITLAADALAFDAGGAGKIRTTGVLQIYPYTADTLINIGSGFSGSLTIDAGKFASGGELGGRYSQLILGRRSDKGDDGDQAGNINISSTGFFAPLTLRSLGIASFSGNTVTGALALQVGGFTADSGSTVTGSGSLTFESDKDNIWVSDEKTADDNNYVIRYDVLNTVMKSFTSYAVKGTRNTSSVTLDGGANWDSAKTINRSVSLTAGTNGTVTLQDYVKLNGATTNVTVTGQEFVVAANSGLDVGAGSFTLNANKLIDNGTGSNRITGTGSLSLMQRDGSTPLYIVTDAYKTSHSTLGDTNLVVTDSQLNGGLFDSRFGSLTLGNTGGSAVTVTGNNTGDSVTLNNNVTIQNGGGASTLTIGDGGLTVKDGKAVTLKSGKIINTTAQQNVIHAGTDSTINLYTNDLSGLAGSIGNTAVIGSGTLGIATYDGSTDISLGEVQHGTESLWLKNDLFVNTFSTNFSHYSIGNTNQENIYVNNFNLGGFIENTTLTARNIVFEGAAHVDGKILTLNASQTVSQTNSGAITADNLAIVGTGKYDLTAAVNSIGTLAAENAAQVKVKAKSLTVGTVTTPAGSQAGSKTVTGITVSGSGVAALDDAIRLETTTTAGLTVNNNIHAGSGNITLTADHMTFDSTVHVSAPGSLTVQQYQPGTTLGIGTGTGALQLGSGLFNGDSRIFQAGFSHIYLGRDDGTGAVTVAGTLNFTDPATIRSPGTGGSVTVKNGSMLTTNNKNLEFKTVTLTAEPGSTVNTGSGGLTITADNLNLAGSSDPAAAPVQGGGELIVQTLTQSRNMYLGQTQNGDPAASLFLQSGYFDGSNGINRVFRDGYNQIILGRVDGTGILYQTGTTGFTDPVSIIQAGNNTTGSVQVTGIINTSGNNFSVSSKRVNITNAQINANHYDSSNSIDYGGNVSITADTLTADTTSWIMSVGDLTVNTYTDGRTINIGGTAGTGLNLSSDWFDGSHLFCKSSETQGFRSITVGSSASGAVTVGNLSLGSGLAETLTFNSGGDINGTGALNNVNTLAAYAGGKVDLSNSGNTIAKLGDITAGQGVSIKDQGGLTLNGTVTGNANNVTIWTTGGNLVLGNAGKVVSHGSTPIYLVAEGAHFINDNPDTAAANLINPGSSRWVIYTADAIGDSYGSLAGDFRRYGTAYGDTSVLTGSSYSGSGFAHVYQPVAKIYGEHVYGDPNSAFFTDPQFSVTIDNGDTERVLLDQSFIVGMTTDQTNSGKYTMGTGLGTATDVNKGITGAAAYGTYNSSDALKASYVGANPLNYKVEVELWVNPKEVTVTANNMAKVYDGLTYSGGNGLTYSGFVNGQNQNTAGVVNSGSVVFGSGSAQGARNVGTYVIGIQDSDLQARNYTFTYVDGTLDITKRSITVTTDNATRVYGAANPAVAGGKLSGGTTLGNGDGISSVDASVSATATPFANAGTTHNINVTGVTFTDPSAAANYDITYAPGTLTVIQRPLIITVDNKNRVYGETNTAAGPLTYQIGTATDNSGLVNGDTITGITIDIDGSLTERSDAGIYAGKIAASNAIFDAGTNDGNYAVSYQPGTLTITPRSLLIAADNKIRVYGESNAAAGPLTYTVGTATGDSGLVNGDTLAGVSVGIDGSVTENSGAGTYTGKIAAHDAGFAGGAKNGNYEITYIPGNLTITPRPVVITAGSTSRVYGENNAVFNEFSVEHSVSGTGRGLLGSDSITAITDRYDASVDSATYAGTYSGVIHPVAGSEVFNGSNAGNYSFTYASGDLTVTPRPVVIIAGSTSRVYGEDNTVFNEFSTERGVSGTGRGLLGSDSITAITNRYDTSVDSATYAGTYSDVIHPVAGSEVFSGSNAGNYSFNYVSGDLTVTPRPVLITAGDTSRVYGDPNAPFNGFTAERGTDGTGRGLLGPDDITGITDVYDTAITSATHAGTYTSVIKPVAGSQIFSGGNAGNYLFQYAPGNLEITPRPVTLTAGNASRYYGDSNPTVTAFLAETGIAGTGRGLVNGAAFTGVTSLVDSAVNEYTGAGTYNGAVQIASYSFAPGVNASDYNVTYVPGNLSILKAPLVITADDQRRPQNTDNPVFIIRYDGFKNGESESVVTGLAVMTPADRSSLPGSYDIAPGNGAADNYEISYVKGILTVYPVKAVDEVKTVAQPRESGTVPPAASPEPAVTQAQPVVPDVAVPGLPVNTSGILGDVFINIGGSVSQRSFVTDNAGFGLQWNTPHSDDSGMAGTSRTSGAVPVLFAQSGEQKLDGIYTINYNPDKLSILPSAQKATIPRLEEVAPDINKNFSMVYKTETAGSFEVGFGNGIVVITPLDGTALNAVTAPNREASRAVMATGILTAVEDLGVMPDQIRAIYIYTETKTNQ